MRKPVIAYVGMTHLGLNSAAGGVARGFKVVGFDLDQGVINRLQDDDLPVVEPDLLETIAKHRDDILFTSDVDDLSACDVIYVAPDVATDGDGSSDLSTLEILLMVAMDNISPDAVLIVLSQVPPGFTRQRQRDGLRLFYQVETLIFGRAIERAVFPERFIVGCDDPNVRLPAAYQTYLDAFDCPVLPMRYESAELAKISINFCLVASISVANVLAELCEAIGADWSEISPALKLDKRIGEFSYLKPGLGIAGGNLERDLTTVISLSNQHKTDTRIVEAWIQNSQHRRMWAANLLQAEIDAERVKRIAILGLTYKENTHSTKNSPSIATIRALNGADIRAYDPEITVEDAELIDVTDCASALEVCEDADALAVLTPWPVFKELSLVDIARQMRGRLLIDPYGIFDPMTAADAGLDVRTLGR